MKIGFVMGSSIAGKNASARSVLQRSAREYGHSVENFLPETDEKRSYIDAAILAGRLLNEQEVDFVIGGCSSGLGFQLAMNQIPNVLCGYGTTPIEANFFARINRGNAFSYPFALNWGWGAEEQFSLVLDALFSGMTRPIYPEKEATRKVAENEKLTALGKLSKITYEDWKRKVRDL